MKRLLLPLLLVILTFTVVSCNAYDKRTHTKDAKIEKQIQNKLVETETVIQKELAWKEQKEETYLRLKEKFE